MKYTSLAVLALLGKVSAEQVKHMKNVRTPHGNVWLMRESDDLANGDRSDDKEVEDEYDNDDDIVDDSGFVHKWLQTGSNLRKKVLSRDEDNLSSTVRVYKNTLANDRTKDTDGNRRTSDGLANGDYHDDHQVEDERDIHDDVIDENFYSKIKKQRNFVQLGRYSDELANGDTADDRDIHEDEDMNDDVVDYNGQTNAGYGSSLPTSYFDHNNINDISGGHFLTDPAAIQMGNQNMRVRKHKHHSLAQAKGPAEDYLNAHCEGGPDECPMKYFRDNHIDYISGGHFLTDPAALKLKNKGNRLVQKPIKPYEYKEEKKPSKEEIAKKEKDIETYLADNCVQNDGVGASECPMKFQNHNNINDEGPGHFVTEPRESFAQKQNIVQVNGPAEDYLNAHCEGGPDECPMKYFRDNHIDYISGGHFLTDPAALKIKNSKHLAQVNGPAEDYLNAHCEGGPDECPMKYFRDNHIDYISGGHFLTDPAAIQFKNYKHKHQNLAQGKDADADEDYLDAHCHENSHDCPVHFRKVNVPGNVAVPNPVLNDPRDADPGTFIKRSLAQASGPDEDEAYLDEHCHENSHDCPVHFRKVNVPGNVAVPNPVLHDPRDADPGTFIKLAQAKGPAEDYLNQHCEGGPDECPMKYFRDNHIDYISGGHFLTDPAAIQIKKRKNLAQLRGPAEDYLNQHCEGGPDECPMKYFRDNHIDYISGGHFLTDPAAIQMKKPKHHDYIQGSDEDEAYLNEHCQGNSHDCPSKFRTVNVPGAVTAVNPYETDPKKADPETFAQTGDDGDDELNNTCIGDAHQCPSKFRTVNTPGNITAMNPSNLAHLVQLQDDDDDEAYKACPSVNWAECPMYFKEQNNINSIGRGHFSTNPNRNDISKPTKAPTDDSFIQTDEDIPVGHWWGDIQNLAKKNRDMDESFVQIDDDVNPIANAWSLIQIGSKRGYADEIANGDEADNKDIHEDEDMNDDVVDYNGQTNAGYGSTLPTRYFSNNNIDNISPGHFLTDPDDQ